MTVDGHTYQLPGPFLVMATQNPNEMEGTYPLPEAQRDRFMARVSVGYPQPAAEADMLASHGARDPLSDLQAVTTAEQMQHIIGAVRGLHVSPALRRYVVDLVTATRKHQRLRLGASPRAGLQLQRAAQAHAALAGRAHVIPEDVQAMAHVVLPHRLILNGEAQLARASAGSIVAEILQQTRVPALS